MVTGDQPAYMTVLSDDCSDENIEPKHHSPAKQNATPSPTPISLPKLTCTELKIENMSDQKHLPQPSLSPSVPISPIHYDNDPFESEDSLSSDDSTY